jgi:predicted ATPase/class 3 adenylate cyclase
MVSLPGGTVAFLFTDIEGSTPLWEKQPNLMAEALQVHNQVLCRAIEANEGVVFRFVGDAIHAAFPTALQALEAAVAGQRGLTDAKWNELGALKVRMGIHTGEAYPNEAGDYDAHTLNRVARVMSAGHGGQILLSEVSAKLCERTLPEGIELVDRGQHRLKGLSWLERLYQVSGSGLEVNFPPLNTLDSHPHNLPSQLTSFLGREREIAQIRQMMNKSRLVTLTGPGGVGKTRLSLEMASQALEDFPEGVWFVELAVVHDPESIPQTVAKAIGLQRKTNLSMLEVLCTHLERKKTLIVLDNCEHMVEACASFAEKLLVRNPGVCILSTSREVFRIQGEAVYVVPSLTFPDPYRLPTFEEFTAFEAVRLFEERTRAVARDFRLSEENAYSIARICQHLDGIPLAIELAAARSNILTPAQIAVRLEDVFGLLTSGKRTSLPRHQTLLAAIRWSYDLLNDKERRLLCRLSVFLGGWSLEAAEEVCSGKGISKIEIFELLCSLVNKSMVLAQQAEAEENRYLLLETIRQYAEEELLEAGETDWTARQHFEYYLAEAEKNNAYLSGPLVLRAFMWFVREQPNLRAALDWASCGVPPHDQPGAEHLAEIIHHDWHGHGTHRIKGIDL